jgi:hypothetical protein
LGISIFVSIFFLINFFKNEFAASVHFDAAPPPSSCGRMFLFFFFCFLFLLIATLLRPTFNNSLLKSLTDAWQTDINSKNELLALLRERELKVRVLEERVRHWWFVAGPSTHWAGGAAEVAPLTEVPLPPPDERKEWNSKDPVGRGGEDICFLLIVLRYFSRQNELMGL